MKARARRPAPRSKPTGQRPKRIAPLRPPMPRPKTGTGSLMRVGGPAILDSERYSLWSGRLAVSRLSFATALATPMLCSCCALQLRRPGHDCRYGVWRCDGVRFWQRQHPGRDIHRRLSCVRLRRCQRRRSEIPAPRSITPPPATPVVQRRRLASDDGARMGGNRPVVHGQRLRSRLAIPTGGAATPKPGW